MAIDHETHVASKHKTHHDLLPDLEHAKAAVLNSLTSQDAQRGYRHAIDEFVDWYCSDNFAEMLVAGVRQAMREELANTLS